MIYVTLYAVSRDFGGPEEGGWYYDWYQPVPNAWLALPDDASDDMIDAARTELLAAHGWENRHGRSSVLGGEDAVIVVEDSLHEHASTERPHYE